MTTNDKPTKQDPFSEARSLVKRIRKGDADIAARAEKWQAERAELLASASPVARVAAEAELGQSQEPDEEAAPDSV